MGDSTRVWELARDLGVTTAEVLDALRARNQHLSSHLSTIPSTALEDLRRTLHPAEAPHDEPLRPGANPLARPRRPPVPGRNPGRRRRRPPGPAPVTYQPPPAPYDPDDDYYDYEDPRDELRRQPVLSTRDVAELCGVSTACVRQWVTRGHLTPLDKNGPSHTFETHTVLTAAKNIRQRTRHRAYPTDPTTRPVTPPGLPGAGKPLNNLETHRIARVYPNRVLNTSDAAALVGVKPTTLRSWVKRGHLTPLPTSTPRRLEFRLADLLHSTGRVHI